MIITFKTLQQQTFTIDVDESLTIKDLKKRVNEERGPELPAESLNLIYSGAIMKDEEQVRDYKMDSKKFIVVMKRKEKVEPVAEATSSTSTTSTSSTPAAAAPKPESTATEKKPAAQEPTASATATPPATASADNEGVIRNMMELGYPRPLVEAALRLAYNNPDVACEYLFSERITEANMDSVDSDNLALAGVREELLVDAFENQAAAAVAGGQAAGGSAENEPLAFLRAQPQFNAMRQQIQENPQFLNTVLQQIGVNNPGLLKLISENQTAFVNMINEPVNNNNTNNNRNTSSASASAPAASTAAAAVAPAVERMDEDEANLTANDDLLAATLASQLADEDEEEEEQAGGQQQQGEAGGQQQALAGEPQRVELELSEVDRAAINRIREISGFSEIEVVQAYIACGKNEELALNFLFTD